jgi:superfamily II DNA helicase RecQ
MINYSNEIEKLRNLTFGQIRQVASDSLSSADRVRPWEGLNHGVDLLDTHEKCCRYLLAYGEMHEAKIHYALDKLTNLAAICQQNFSIIDWGCGQGLATVCFFDYLNSHNIANKVQKVILIEPSNTTRERAKLHTNAYLKDERKIKTIAKGLDDVTKDDIKTDTPITLHFFSNILSVPFFDLKKLATLIGSDINGIHYLICVDPLNCANQRMLAFFRYFEESTKIIEDAKSDLIKVNNGHTAGIKLLTFKLEQGKTNLIQIEYYPPVQFHAAYQLDCIKSFYKNQDQERQNKIVDFYKQQSDFELSAPFDIGASIYDDVNPILAVLNNVVTRGLPTKASPFIEEKFAALGNSRKEDNLGAIIFDNSNLLENQKQILYSPIGIARIQKTVLEALMTSVLDISQAEWNLIVIERDFSCAALAFEDLRQMFEHISALSQEYGKMKLPKINLEIISTDKFVNSPLHLDIKPTTKASIIQNNKEYDLVIDISLLEKYEPENNHFSEFKCKNNCYFNIRTAQRHRTERYIYTSDTIDYKTLVTKDQQGNYADIEENKEHLKYFLQLLFRKEDFRPGQLPILSRALQNKSVIGLLPTGGGKSLTYQIAAMLQPGVTLVIDPLRSLMKDQYDGLINAGIDTCTFINSTLDQAEKDKRERQMEFSQMQFVFLSPERLCIYKFRERLRTMRDMHVYFAYGVIDEVHCVSEWGHDFRFSYLHLGRNLYKYVCPKNQEKHLTLFGLTATASFDVLADVERELSGNDAYTLDSDTIVRYENTNRLELQYKIEKVDVEYEPDKFFDKNEKLDRGLPKAVNIGNKWAVYEAKQRYLANYIPEIPQFINELLSEESENEIKDRFNERQNLSEEITDSLHTDFSNDFYETKQEYEQAGIVFCPHRNSTGISVNVNASGLQNYIKQVGTFMGSGEDDNAEEIDRVSFENLDKFRDNKLPLMVATKAFGMGIDKPNVRFTVNMNYSSSLESFVQEAGRAGRDKKMALSTILFADYELVRINSKCPVTQLPLIIIKNKWFKKKDLDIILRHYNISIDKQYIDYFTPEHDLVKLRCEISNKIFAFGECQMKCDKFNQCDLCKIPQEAKGFQYYKDLEQLLKERGFEIPKKSLEYLSADYETVLFFYNNNFKGSLLEKQTMHQILSKSQTKFFENDDEEVKIGQIESVNNFLEKLLSSEVGTELVAFISYTDNYADYAKAIYRMCCIGLIDDFTQDYVGNRFRIVTKRKADGEYYQGLKRFLMRYYSTDRAEEEIQKVPNYKGDNEIHKCLGYLTEFIYDKIAVKRKRAIDDMRQFCIEGLNDAKDWKEVNEDLKDFIYYYFNSKYAKDDYVADNGEEFSLTKDTDSGKQSNTDIVFKYMRVIDDELVGAGGTPKDNIKHLQGAVRLIRRSLTDTNPALDLLNAFCLFYLGTNNNETLEKELIESYSNGLFGFKERENVIVEFWQFFDKLNAEIDKRAKDFPNKKFVEIKNTINLEIHAEIIKEITNKYIS